MASGKTGIYFVEDNDVIRFTVRSVLNKVAEFEIVGESADGATAVEGVLNCRPDVAIIDIQLPNLDGITIAQQIKESMPQVCVVMLTASDDPCDVFDALEAGADGYVLKPNHCQYLEIAIRSARVGSVWLDPAIARLVLNAASRPVSSRRQAQVEPVPLTTNELAVLDQVAHSNCTDGVCLVDQEFVSKLKRFSQAPQRAAETTKAQAQVRSEC